MTDKNSKAAKEQFLSLLKGFAITVAPMISVDGEWIIRGIIDNKKNVYPVSADTKLLSKIMELQVFPHLKTFFEQKGFDFEPPEFQNTYPDATVINKEDRTEMYAIDIKTTYREDDKRFCNGFTLGSHGKYFVDRNSEKNIQHPYSQYKGHFVLGVIYTRCEIENTFETTTYTVNEVETMPAVVKDFEVFAEEKWKIASDGQGSGNTANIGSITYINDILTGNGTFAKAGEKYFDDYWVDYDSYKKQHSKNKLTFKEYLRINNLDDSLLNSQIDKKTIKEIDETVISGYVKGLSACEISGILKDKFCYEASEGFISDIKERMVQEIQEWQNRALNAFYPIIYFYPIYYSVKENSAVKDCTAYVILGINSAGKKEILTIDASGNEGSKYWLTILDGLKNRGVKDILIICADGLNDIHEAIQIAFPMTDYHSFILQKKRNTLEKVNEKDRNALSRNMNTIYKAPNEKDGRASLEKCTEKWSHKYPDLLKHWECDWDKIAPIFRFSPELRAAIYEKDMLESLKKNHNEVYQQCRTYLSSLSFLASLYQVMNKNISNQSISKWDCFSDKLKEIYEGRFPA